MSNKSRQRRIAASRSVSSAQATKAAGELFDQLLAELWDALRAGDLLRAEVAASRCMILPQLLGLDQDKSDAIFIKMTTQGRTQEDAALLRLMALLGSPAVKRSASRTLADLTASGVYPAEWVAGAGKAVPGQAWRRQEALGDQETIIVTFRYGDDEHAFVVGMDLISIPLISGIGLLTDPAELAGLADRIKRPMGGFGPAQDITLAQARGWLEEALANTETTPDLRHETIGFMPILRSRLRRLPAADDEPPEEFTAADRAAAVDAFMGSPQAADAIAADPAATRYWAELLSSYSSRVRGEPPTRVGPLKLEFILTSFVPRTYTLTEAQRRHMRPAVTAWALWSAAHRGLDESDTGHMADSLTEAFDGFDAAYDDPYCAAQRAYTSDVATSDADITSISEHGRRRRFAMPPPGQRDDGGQTGLLDASDPPVRQSYAAAEFGGCALPGDLTREDYLAAVQGVIEELWLGEPGTTWKRAQRLVAGGAGRHDVIHALVRQASAAP